MIYRIDVKTTPLARGGQAALDPVGESVRQQIREFGKEVGPIQTWRIFLIDADAESALVERAATTLLADPVVESAEVVRSAPDDAGHSRIEIHLKPGVMDPVAESTEMALRDMGLLAREVRTGRAYLIDGVVPRKELRAIAGRVLANGVIESVHFDAYVPEKFETGKPVTFALKHVPLRLRNDAELLKLSRQGHLFLSLDEMKAIQTYFREQNREPTDIELETLAQTWSEHCVHKTLKSSVDVEVRDAAGKPIGSRRYKNLIKETIFDSTMQLMARRGGKDFCLSVFADNAGVIAFDDADAVCFKVETHNHPSAIEPYGGSATGIGGVIRDILGTGLAAKPVANTDVFCVAYPDWERGIDRGAAGAAPAEKSAEPRSLPKGIIHPKRVLQQIMAGVRDYGNRMGIPTVNGAVYFDDNYLGNPLVFCGCVGLIPRDKIRKQTGDGDAIVVMGGRTGRDGIHGATFSSAELTDTHADEFSHAVQIGNAITEKKVGDVILQARDRQLFSAITDCGAGGLSSAVGEMGEKIGASVDLEKVPLKYAGLRYDEIWISEAQERMVLSVPEEKLHELLALAASEDVEATVIGVFGTAQRDLILCYHNTEVCRMAMSFIHSGIPMPTRKAVVVEGAKTQAALAAGSEARRSAGASEGESGSSEYLRTGVGSHVVDSADVGDIKSTLLRLLAHPNIASKHWIIRQYDHEVQGGSVIKPLTGPLQVGPSDAAVVRPKLGSHRGIVIGCGMTPNIADAYEMSLASIDEAIRNVVAVGADPAKVAVLDNFCWPSVDDEMTMGTLVRACEACRDAALAYGIPFISGKDSLHNQFTDSETGRVLRIPNTLLISAIGVIDDVRKCITMDFKRPGNEVFLVSPAKDDLAGRIALHRHLAKAIAAGNVASCHDISDGGLLTAIAEMSIASDLGFAAKAIAEDPFAERMASYVIEAEPGHVPALRAALQGAGAVVDLGAVVLEKQLTWPGAAGVELHDLRKAWRGTLDW